MQRKNKNQEVAQRTDSFLEKYAPSAKGDSAQEENRFAEDEIELS